MKRASLLDSTVALLRKLNSNSPPKPIDVLDADALQIMCDRRTALGELAGKVIVSDPEVKARAEQLGLASQTVWTWLSHYRVYGLADWLRIGDRTPTLQNISSAVVDLVRGIRLSNKDWPVGAVCTPAEKMTSVLGVSVPSMRQVR